MTTTVSDRSPTPHADAPARTSYSLLTEPWLRVRDTDGVYEVGLLEAFDRADELQGFAGDIPTQDAACLRLMLAILYRTVDRMDLDVPADAWEEWWRAERLPVAEVRDYLEPYADRFDLLHRSAPFFQVAGLHTATGKTSGLGKLVAEVPDGYPFFTTRSAADIGRLSYAEAARWLVHAQAYDCSGIKSGAVGDSRVKGGKGYPIGTGFAGTLGLIVAEGKTLAQTLLLNLVLTVDTARDVVPWERDPLGAAVDSRHTQPLGPADAATWQARRIRLIHDGSAVTDAMLSNGDPIGPQNRQAVEPNSSWRYSDPQTKKLGAPTYMPLEHVPGRSMWRGLSATLGERTTEVATKAGKAAFQPAALLDWLATRRRDRVLTAPDVTLRAIGMTYGAQSASVTEVIDDRLVLPLAVLSDPQVKACATGAVDRSDEAVRALARLAANLADASGRHLLPGMEDGARAEAVRATFHRLGSEYQRWLRTLRDAATVDDRDVEWQRTLRAVVEDVAGELIGAAGAPAFIGREVGGRLLNAPIAENYFRAALRKALPQAYPSPGSLAPPSRTPSVKEES